LLINALINISG